MFKINAFRFKARLDSTDLQCVVHPSEDGLASPGDTYMHYISILTGATTPGANYNVSCGAKCLRSFNQNVVLSLGSGSDARFRNVCQ